jgi:hypothetical protein
MRHRPIVAAASEYYYRDAEMYSDLGPLQAMPDGLVAALE